MTRMHGAHLLLRCCAISSVLLTLLAAAVAAQGSVMRGTVVDELTNQPVVATIIQLVDASGRGVLSVTSDAKGAFNIAVPTSGKYKLRADRLGYFTRETREITVTPEHATIVEIYLSPHPIRFDSLLVTGKVEARKLNATEQLIHGRLLDDDSREPIKRGAVELLSKGKVISTTLADDYGLFRLVTPNPGPYKLRAMQVGYKTADSPDLKLTLGDTIRLDFHLSARAVLLAPIVVTATSRDWSKRGNATGMEDFYARMRRFSTSKYGEFITRDSLEMFDRNQVPTSRIIDTMIKRAPEGRNPRPAICPGPDCVLTCIPETSYYVNGVPYGMQNDVNDAFPPRMLESMEVYGYPDIPAEFSIPPSREGIAFQPPCRVVVLWTRR